MHFWKCGRTNKQHGFDLKAGGGFCIWYDIVDRLGSHRRDTTTKSVFDSVWIGRYRHTIYPNRIWPRVNKHKSMMRSNLLLWLPHSTRLMVYMCGVWCVVCRVTSSFPSVMDGWWSGLCVNRIKADLLTLFFYFIIQFDRFVPHFIIIDNATMYMMFVSLFLDYSIGTASYVKIN